VGIGLIIFPVEWLRFFGFADYSGHFFMTQAGVFHLIMGGIYWRGAYLFPESLELVYITIIVKTIAAIFLLSYFFLEPNLWLILLSGIVDGVMASLLYTVFWQLKEINSEVCN
jgi:hypothetical protein